MHKIEIDAEIDLLSENRRLAAENRKFLREQGIVAVNIMGAIGSGKTLFIEKTVEALRDIRIGVILGDVICRADYERVAAHDVVAEPVNTGKECHLDAHLIHHRIRKFEDVDLLLIENVGNLICPVDFDLGEDFRVVMVSVTEGDDVVEKHPEIFRLADVIIINKVALAEFVEADVDKMEKDARNLNPEARIIRMDLKKDIGFEEWIEFLRGVLNVSGNSG
ncbi:hydrogenase nickel incorporation protein HypB [Geoglobus acetivorans]|uniref:[NiFe] hydrogenase nickel incorporation-associated protein HypB n=1 Tax=Geoglobus acetivorans TaxID=565033 RepID=A0A0A7GHC6_GEOAI|nr:[NiFe] hydrogenase nickel incorporation-associated protein HypB [Geoglobus acetivorans]